MKHAVMQSWFWCSDLSDCLAENDRVYRPNQPCDLGSWQIIVRSFGSRLHRQADSEHIYDRYMFLWASLSNLTKVKLREKWWPFRLSFFSSINECILFARLPKLNRFSPTERKCWKSLTKGHPHVLSPRSDAFHIRMLTLSDGHELSGKGTPQYGVGPEPWSAGQVRAMFKIGSFIHNWALASRITWILNAGFPQKGAWTPLLAYFGLLVNLLPCGTPVMSAQEVNVIQTISFGILHAPVLDLGLAAIFSSGPSSQPPTCSLFLLFFSIPE